MTFTIRTAQERDAQSIASIHVESWHAAFKGLMPIGYINRYTKALRLIEWHDAIKLDTTGVSAIEQNQQVVGFLSYQIKPSAPDTLELDKLYLCPSIYGKGAGGLLMEHVESLARIQSASWISLYVLDSNQTAIQFYSKRGFEFTQESVSEEFEGKVITDLRMRKSMLP